MRKLIIKLLILNCAFLIINCSENPTKPPPPPPVMETRDTITVNLEQQTHRSISVRLTKKLKVNSDKYILNRISGQDTFAFMPFALSPSDTLIIDDNDGAGLNLDSEYSYFAYRLDSTGTAKDTSNTISAKTLAATSHDYSWTEYTLGSGALYDVWGTDENNVYAVGSVRFGDSTFGVIKWNGAEWKPEVFTGGKQAIFGFSKDDIWVGGNGGVLHYNGQEWERIGWDFDNGSIIVTDPILDGNKPYTSIWGTGSENLYFAGERGKVVHWDGEKASIVHDAGDNQIGEMHGTAFNNIWASGSTADQFSYVAHFDGKKWQEVDMPYNRLNASAIYSVNNRETYLGGNGLFFGEPGFFYEIEYPANIYIDEIKGPASNNLFACGSFGFVMHFNGVDWKRIDPFPTEFGRLRGIYCSNNTVFIAGKGDNSAQILIGTR